MNTSFSFIKVVPAKGNSGKGRRMQICVTQALKRLAFSFRIWKIIEISLNRNYISVIDHVKKSSIHIGFCCSFCFVYSVVSAFLSANNMGQIYLFLEKISAHFPHHHVNIKWFLCKPMCGKKKLFSIYVKMIFTCDMGCGR